MLDARHAYASIALIASLLIDMNAGVSYPQTARFWSL